MRGYIPQSSTSTKQLDLNTWRKGLHRTNHLVVAAVVVAVVVVVVVVAVVVVVVVAAAVVVVVIAVVVVVAAVAAAAVVVIAAVVVVMSLLIWSYLNTCFQHLGAWLPSSRPTANKASIVNT